MFELRETKLNSLSKLDTCCLVIIFILRVCTKQIDPISEGRKAPQAQLLERKIIYKTMSTLENNALNTVPFQPKARVSIQPSRTEKTRSIWNKVKSRLHLYYEGEM